MAGGNDVVIRLVFDDSGADKLLSSIDKKMADLEKQAKDTGDAMGDAMKAGREEGEKTEKTLSEQARALIKNKKAAQEAKEAADDHTESTKKQAQEVQKTNTVFHRLITTLKEKKARLLESVQAMRGSISAITILRGAAALLAVGLLAGLVVALTAVVTNLLATQKNMETLQVKMAGLRGVASVLKERFSALGGELLKSRTWADVFDAFRNSVRGLVQDAEFARIKFEQFATTMQEVAKARALLDIQRAASAEKLSKLESTQGKTFAKQEKDAMTAAAIRQNLVNEQIKQQEKIIAGYLGEEKAGVRTKTVLQQIGTAWKGIGTQADFVDLVTKELSVTNQTFADGFKPFSEEVIKLFELQNQKTEIQIGLDTKLSGISKERQAQVEQLRKEYEQLFNELQTNLANIEAVESPIAELFRQKEDADRAARELIKNLQEAARKYGRDDNFKIQLETILKFNEDVFEEARRQLTGEIPAELPQIDIFGKATKDKLAKDAGDALLGAAFAAEEQLGFFDELKQKLGDALGLDDEETQMMLDSWGQAAASIQDSILTLTEAQLEANERIVDAIRYRIDETEAALNREIELAQAGFANNVDLKRRELEALKQQESKYLKEQEDLRRKYLRQQLVADSVQQVSSLITTAAEITKGFSKFGPAALILIPLALATIFGIFAKAKATAAKSAAVPKFREGGRLEGETHEKGGVPVVVDGKQMIEAERGEWIIGTKHSKEHDTFLARLNSGTYKGMNLEKAAEVAIQMRRDGRNQNVTNYHGITSLSGLEAVIRSENGRVVKAITEKPSYLSLEPGVYMEIKENANGKKIKVVKT